MRVMAGWSGEMASGQWSKIEIELDEYDLKRLLSERSPEWDEWDAGGGARTADVFTALISEAERLKEATLYRRFDSYRTDEVKTEIGRLTATRDAALDRVLGRSSTA